MNFLEKLDMMMKKYSLNKRSLSMKSGIPYTTIDGWYKKGYEGMKLQTLRTLANYFNTPTDFWISDDVTDPNAWKSNGFVVNSEEMEIIQKYRLISPDWKKAMDSVLDIGYQAYERRQTEDEPEEPVCFVLPYYLQPSSAGTGEYGDGEEFDELTLSHRPPRGTSYVVRVHGDSMEPDYHDGDLVFVRAAVEIRPGQIGIFEADGKTWIKELGEGGRLLSHNPAYPPLPLTERSRCQGLVLGICDNSYF